MNFKKWKVKPVRSIRKLLHNLNRNRKERFVIPDKGN